MPTTTPRPDLDAIARPSGTFAILALDQRESLRTIVAERTGVPVAAVPNRDLEAFKVAVARALTPVASAVLLDVDLGLRPVLDAGALAPRCGLILAADALVQHPGQAVTATDVDPRVTPATAVRDGAVALKLLVLWHGGQDRARAVDLGARFVAACRSGGLLSVLEPIVRPPLDGDGAGWDRESAILDAAEVLGSLGADLYKAEVPLHGRADPTELTRRAAAITERVRGPWVVLSQGVDLADFAAAVEASCRGGASGFLAGRAVWTDSIATRAPAAGGFDGLAERLETVARPRFEALAATVDRFGRPWREARRADARTA